MAIQFLQAIDPSWKQHLVRGCPIGIGLDPGTTEQGYSNPTGFCVTQKMGMDYVVRLLARWKTNDPEITTGLILQALEMPHNLRPRRLVIDASSEKFFAADLRKKLRGKCQVELVSSTQTMRYRGEEMSAKVYLGNLLINTLEDGQLWLPESKWVQNDFRLVKRDKGSFSTEVDSSGGHGDTFDACKLSLHALVSRGGPAVAHAAPVGTEGKRPSSGGSWPPKRPDRFDRRKIKPTLLT